MGLYRIQQADVAGDGHPCEAALEFRRAAVRAGVVEEVPADALDLAISYAWIGKALSRTELAGKWIATGTDPNTWQMVRAMASSRAALDAARETAWSGQAAKGFETELEELRASSAFRNAMHQIDRVLAGDARGDILARIARRLPGSAAVPSTLDATVVDLSAFRRSKAE